jgi:hypothetical protein
LADARPGRPAILRDVFERVPGRGRGDRAARRRQLGIGGDPVRLLRRMAQLLAPGGRVVADLAPPGTGLHSGSVRLSAGGLTSEPFPWSVVGADAMPSVATAAGFAPRRHDVGDRWVGVAGGGGGMTALKTPPIPEQRDFPSACTTPRRGPGGGVAGHLLLLAFATGSSATSPSKPDSWLPSRPVWGYRLTQGAPRRRRHRLRAALLVKLWTGLPQLLDPAAAAVPGAAAARAPNGPRSVCCVAAAIFQLATGLANVTTWYPGRSRSGPPTSPWPGW